MHFRIFIKICNLSPFPRGRIKEKRSAHLKKGLPSNPQFPSVFRPSTRAGLLSVFRLGLGSYVPRQTFSRHMAEPCTFCPSFVHPRMSPSPTLPRSSISGPFCSPARLLSSSREKKLEEKLSLSLSLWTGLVYCCLIHPFERSGRGLCSISVIEMVSRRRRGLNWIVKRERMLGARRLSLERRKRMKLLEILEIEALNYLIKGIRSLFLFLFFFYY